MLINNDYILQLFFGNMVKLFIILQLLYNLVVIKTTGVHSVTVTLLFESNRHFVCYTVCFALFCICMFCYFVSKLLVAIASVVSLFYAVPQLKPLILYN